MIQGEIRRTSEFRCVARLDADAAGDNNGLRHRVFCRGQRRKFRLENTLGTLHPETFLILHCHEFY